MISSILLVGALLMASTASASQDTYRCADALQKTEIRYTPAGPRLEFEWRPGYESCVNFIRRVVPLVVKGEACIGIEFLDSDRVIACLPRIEI